MDNFKKIFYPPVWKIDFVRNLKLKKFIIIDNEIISISFFINNLSFFVLNEADGVKL